MEMIDVIKQIAQNTVENHSTVKFCYGTVISSKPLQIKIDNKFVLQSNFLILTNDVKKFNTTISITGPNVDKGGDDLDLSEKKAIIDNSLKDGEKVVLMKFQDGKKYIVLTRI